MYLQLERKHSELSGDIGDPEDALIKRAALGRILALKLKATNSLKDNVKAALLIISGPAILQLYSGQGGNRSTKPSCLH